MTTTTRGAPRRIAIPLFDDFTALDGLRATTHWLSLERLREHGASPTGERVVEQGRVITAAGVSSGIDMALALAGRIARGSLGRWRQQPRTC